MDALFEITYGKDFTCPICMGAKVPYCTLSPCGHSLCAPCAEKCQHCPECRGAIATRTVSANMAEVVANHAHYQCNGCHQAGDRSFAQQHRCDQMMSALRKQLEDANAAHEVAMAAAVDGHKTQIEELEAEIVEDKTKISELQDKVIVALVENLEDKTKIAELQAQVDDALATAIQSLHTRLADASKAKGGDDEVPEAGGPPANASAKNERASSE